MSVPVALFTRAWIEISIFALFTAGISVALFTRAWIEMVSSLASSTTA